MLIRELGTLLTGYWDADFVGSISEATGSVSSWRDLVAGYNTSQATALSQPGYSPSAFNGRPCLTFDGTNHFLNLASVPFPTGAAACEIWALVDQEALAADATGRRIFSYGGTSANNSRWIARAVSGGVNRGGTGGGSGAAQANVNGTIVDFSGRHVVRGTFDGALIGVSVDGNALATTALVPATSTTRTRIGAATPNTATNFFQGKIAAVAVTPLLTAEQESSMRAFLSARI
ncbi:LamG domain-containing protein [Mesorhizobium sp. M0923]|uniref:hypothetical protein n=1 Tax=Mesorhizobium sp. M0923 TaxID=2957028 RepID=UPI00333D17C9